MTVNRRRKSLLPLVQTIYTHHLGTWAMTLFHARCQKPLILQSAEHTLLPKHLCPPPRVGGFGAAAQPQKHSELAPNITNRPCPAQAVTSSKGAKFLARPSSLSSHSHFSFDPSAPLIRFLNSSRSRLLSFLTSSDPRGLAEARLKAHHALLCHLWCNVSLWEMMGSYHVFAQKQKVILRKKTQRRNFPGMN